MRMRLGLLNHRSALAFRCVVAVFGLIVLGAGGAFAQIGRGGAAAAGILAAMGLGLLVFIGVFYVYFALALQTIAKKTNTPNGWMAWIPIVQAILMIQIAQKPIWWIILCLIPLVNVVVGIIIWMAIAKARGKPEWWGILLIVPVVNIIVPGYLAWAD